MKIKFTLISVWLLSIVILSPLFFQYVVSHDNKSIVEPLVSTFSIVGFDPANGDLGIAVQSKFPNVRAVVPWAKAGVGAVATQSFAKIDYATKGLELMKNGASAEEALKIVLKDDEGREQRQVGIVDAKGNAATWTGSECSSWAGAVISQGEGRPNEKLGDEAGRKSTVVTGKNYTAQGNILVGKETVDAMAKAFEETGGELSDKLMAALVAGGKAGGDQRGEQSAALLVVREGAGYDGMDNYIDISVYDHKTPIAELERLYKLNNLYFTQSKSENMIPITEEIAKDIQAIWKKRGFYEGEIDGVVDKDFQDMLVDFMGWENYDLRISNVKNVDLSAGEKLMIDKEVLKDIKMVFEKGLWKPKLR